jgi:hypothetical protein
MSSFQSGEGNQGERRSGLQGSNGASHVACKHRLDKSGKDSVALSEASLTGKGRAEHLGQL